MIPPRSEEGFTRLPNAVLRSARLSPGAKIAYALPRDYAGRQRVAFPGRRLLCARMPTSLPVWRRSLKALVALGLISVERRGQGKTNRYWIEPLTPAVLARLLPPDGGGAATGVGCWVLGVRADPSVPSDPSEHPTPDPETFFDAPLSP